MKVICFDLLRLLHHLFVVLVNEDSADRLVASEVCDNLVHVDRLTHSRQGIVMS